MKPLIILTPLPSVAMDLVLGLSLAGSLALLVLSPHVERTLQPSTFPSFLLIITLLRLAPMPGQQMRSSRWRCSAGQTCSGGRDPVTHRSPIYE